MTRHDSPRSRAAAPRWLRGLALGLVSALALTGCMKITTDLTLKPDNTGSMSMVMAISDEFAQSMGMDPQEMWDQMGSDMATDAPEGADQQPYAEDGYTGVRYTLAEAPIDQLSTPDLTIERDGDDYVVTGTMDLSDTGSGVDTSATEDPTTQAFLDSFVVEVSVTFPGAVGENNGTVDGNTVTWRPPYGEVTEMSARGSAVPGGSAGAGSEATTSASPSQEASPSDEAAADETPAPSDEATEPTVTAADEDAASSGFPWWILVVAGVVLVAAIAGIAVVAARGRKKETPAMAAAGAAAPQWQGQQPQQGWQQPGQQAWGGQPTQEMPPAGQQPPPQGWQQPGQQPPPQGWQQPGQQPPPQGWQQPGQQPPPPPQGWQQPGQPEQPGQQEWDGQPTQQIPPAGQQPPPPPSGWQPPQDGDQRPPS
ncbi:hypothetical protein Q6346_15200 [Isoptericola sp. b490]|uniref:LppM family (lipo)protein n=1 Tax=Actinotalea lenta TaxID=3064654 RepID=UPI00271370EA|nr:hypothetical protein [Isoptericola sp. b490]MDO8122654.1 hypothetical protein [Isoptericola sp. b490]